MLVSSQTAFYFAGSVTMRAKEGMLDEDALKEVEEHLRFAESVHRIHRTSGAGRSSEQRRMLADELSYTAIDCASYLDAISLSLRAVRLNPAQLDARVLLAFAAGGPRDELIEELQQIVRLGEKDLGADFFRENKGHFWLITESRPYMRARGALAQELRAGQRLDDAIAHYETMLELNPNDNQGLRYALLSCYLETERLEAARDLLRRYDEGSAFVLWSRVLERYLSADRAQASAVLREARSKNPHVDDYLTGRRKVPKKLPDAYSPGEVSEAMVCAAEIGSAWRRHKDAISWLKKEHGSGYLH
jgi:tetratricopeptide (TPR) repeat protein